MGEPARKPDICELVGIAVNTSALTLRAGGEGPLERVAAMGAASLAIRLGADHADVSIATAAAGLVLYGREPDVRDALAADLAADLAHIRYGRQYERVPSAVRLFAAWIATRGRFADYAGDEHEVLRFTFADRAIHEWLSDRCVACRGSGKQQRSESGKWICPQGRGQRNAVFRVCAICHGSRRPPSSPPQRMKLLGLTREQYDEQHWDHRFGAAFAWLNQLLPNRFARALTAELERRKRRTQPS